MISSKPLTASERFARLVLTAWSSRQFAEVKMLTEAPFAGIEALPAVERERVDLIQEIGRNLLIWETAGHGKNAGNRNVALALVRHLARCDGDAEEMNARPTKEASLPLETPAFAPRSRYVQ